MLYDGAVPHSQDVAMLPGGGGHYSPHSPRFLYVLLSWAPALQQPSSQPRAGDTINLVVVIDSDQEAPRDDNKVVVIDSEEEKEARAGKR